VFGNKQTSDFGNEQTSDFIFIIIIIYLSFIVGVGDDVGEGDKCQTDKSRVRLQE